MEKFVKLELMDEKLNIKSFTIGLSNSKDKKKKALEIAKLHYAILKADSKIELQRAELFN